MADLVWPITQPDTLLFSASAYVDQEGLAAADPITYSAERLKTEAEGPDVMVYKSLPIRQWDR